MSVSLPCACSVTPAPVAAPVARRRFTVAAGVATSKAWPPGAAPSVTVPALVARSTSVPPAPAGEAAGAGLEQPGIGRADSEPRRADPAGRCQMGERRRWCPH